MYVFYNKVTNVLLLFSSTYVFKYKLNLTNYIKISSVKGPYYIKLFKSKVYFPDAYFLVKSAK